MTHLAHKYQATVGPNGALQLAVPLPEGTSVEVLILSTQPDECKDLLEAAVSSTDFWDNPQDDEDWNDA